MRRKKTKHTDFGQANYYFVVILTSWNRIFRWKFNFSVAQRHKRLIFVINFVLHFSLLFFYTCVWNSLLFAQTHTSQSKLELFANNRTPPHHHHRTRNAHTGHKDYQFICLFFFAQRAVSFFSLLPSMDRYIKAQQFNPLRGSATAPRATYNFSQLPHFNSHLVYFPLEQLTSRTIYKRKMATLKKLFVLCI